MHFSYIRFFFLFVVIYCDVFSLSLIDCTWHPKHVSPLQLGTLLVLGLLLLLLLILSPLFTLGSMMGRPKRTSWRTFRKVAFIQSAMLFCWTFLTLLSPSSFELGVGNLFVRDPWGVPSCLYRSFTPIHTVSIPLYLSLPRHSEGYTYHHSYPKSYIQGTTCSEGSASWLPNCMRLWTMYRDKLLSHFCETPSIWGGKQNTPCLDFAKGPRFLNMVITFTLTPLSHYNSITKPYARFLLSLLEDLSIDFPSHFITSILDVYQDMVTHDKFIFPSAIMQILRHFSIPIPNSPYYTTMGAIDAGSIR